MSLYSKEQAAMSRDSALMEYREGLMDTEGITLNGRPAIIKGRLLAFPIVCTLERCSEGAWHEAEFAWGTVERIIRERNGEFHS